MNEGAYTAITAAVLAGRALQDSATSSFPSPEELDDIIVFYVNLAKFMIEAIENS